jgi:predicted secreted protein
MKKAELKTSVSNLLNSLGGSLTWDERVSKLRQVLVELEQEHNSDESNKGQPWRDEELRLVLTLAPTKENCMALARAFKRGYGSIEQIYRWAATDEDAVAEKRPEDKFVQQIKRIAREVGWRAT